MLVDRRSLIGISAVAAAGLLGPTSRANAPLAKRPLTPQIPRWRGFNLTELLTGGSEVRAFRETDFKWISEFGFDFVRLPMSYWSWSSPDDWMRIDDGVLKLIDEAVEYAQKYGLHVNLNFQRIPGYCINERELEPHLLFDSPRQEMEKALPVAEHHWRTFAERYKGVPSEHVSFDLINEPPWMADQSRYVEIVYALVRAIREVDPGRLIFADGADLGQTPVPGISDLGLVQSTRGYLPKMVSHYTATWVPENEFESFDKPTWPMTDARGVLWNKETLREHLINSWMPLTDQGTAIFVGEWGCYKRTPHQTALAWMRDLTDLWREMNWGWAMWNFRGSFGILDSGRKDVDYVDFRGHRLDGQMLQLLQAT
jgi:endoglucanase